MLLAVEAGVPTTDTELGDMAAQQPAEPAGQRGLETGCCGNVSQNELQRSRARGDFARFAAKRCKSSLSNFEDAHHP